MADVFEEKLGCDDRKETKLTNLAYYRTVSYHVAYSQIVFAVRLALSGDFPPDLWLCPPSNRLRFHKNDGKYRRC